jgi:hypothetical protein
MTRLAIPKIRAAIRMTAGIAAKRAQQKQPFDFFVGLGGV